MSSNVTTWSLTVALKNLREGKISVEEYLTELLAHAKRRDDLQAYITDTGEQAVAAAKLIDRMDPLLLLQGIPLVLKDNIDVAAVPTSGGTPSLREHVPSANSAVWRRLSEAGALLFGKTSMNELAYGVTGLTVGSPTARNPHNTDYLPGGSSSGTAAAVAAGFVPAGLGTDTSGSVRIPAALCGVCGFRPTTGRYLDTGVLRISPTCDTIGIIARTVDDILLLDEIMSGISPSSQLVNLPPESVKLALPTQAWEGLDPEVERITQNALSVLKKAGYSLIDADPTIHGGPSESLLEIATKVPLAETFKAISDYLEDTGSTASLEEVIKDIATPDVRSVLEPLLDEPIPYEDYQEALTRREQLRESASEARANYSVHAVVVPTTIAAAPPIEVGETIKVNGVETPTFLAYIRNTAPAAVLGVPSVTIPVGKTADGLSVGLQFDGYPNEDVELLQLARQCAALFQDDGSD